MLCIASEDRKSNNELKLQENRFRLNNIKEKVLPIRIACKLKNTTKGGSEISLIAHFSKLLWIQNCQRGFGF